MSAKLELSRTHKILIGIVVAGAVVIAGIGFAGSYAAVRELALQKGFGNFSYVFPIGIDAGICVLLALDLLLTWIRIPFPLLRQSAWLLTAATIAFNGAAAWPDPLGVGMHAVIPVLFVVAVEAARHAIGRIADITADKHMEGVRITRWFLSPLPTFLLWRRMKLWELRSYDEVIKLEQERLVYQARLRSRFGRAWRRKAPVESLMPLRLARYGVPLKASAPAGLAAAGIEADELFPVEAPREVPATGQEEHLEYALERLVDGVEPVQEVPAPAEPQEPVVEPQAEAVVETEVTEQYLYDVFVQYGNAYGTETSLVFPNWQELVDASASWYGVVVPADTAPVDLGEFAQWYQAGLSGRPQEPLAPFEEPVAEPVAPARSTNPQRVQAKVEDEQPARPRRGGTTREQVAAIYRELSQQEQELRGRRLAAAIVEASGNTLKVETVRKSHISEELLADYLQAAPVPGPREETIAERTQ
ncbi:DUF2637 domain-containing protein [Streptomyces sp. BH105]|uniref:DUF2637 domain-containing protein n=1 Tax=Streptomyces sp. BH105 TaxID=3410408 RepID=UPI003CE68FBD